MRLDCRHPLVVSTFRCHLLPPALQRPVRAIRALYSARQGRHLSPANRRATSEERMHWAREFVTLLKSYSSQSERSNTSDNSSAIIPSAIITVQLFLGRRLR